MRSVIYRLSIFIIPFMIITGRILDMIVLNPGEIDIIDILRPLIVINLVFFVIIGIFNKFILRDIGKMQIFSCILPFCFFLGNKFGTIMSSVLGGNVNGVIIAGAYLLAVGVIVYLLRKIKKMPDYTGKTVITFAIVLFAFSLGPFFGKLGSLFPRVDSYKVENNVVLPESAREIEDKPNIYVIVLDAFVRSDKFKEIYGEDNSEFIDGLKKQGFSVSRKSLSNYDSTRLSVPSFMNMCYADELRVPKELGSYTSLAAQFSLNNNNFYNILKPFGYTFYTINTGVLFTYVSNSNVLFSPNQRSTRWANPILRSITEFEEVVLSRTIIKPVFGQFLEDQLLEEQRRNVRASLKALSATPELPGPKLVFAHLLIPHDPFVFDRFGQSVRPPMTYKHNINGDGNVDDPKNLQAYADQTVYISTEISKITKNILDKDPAGVIVLVSDHGGRSGLVGNDPEKSDFEDCYPNLIAIKSKKVISDKEIDSITLVNVLRLVSGKYFASEFPLIEDKFYFFFYEESPKPIDVTDKVKKNLIDIPALVKP